MTKALTLAILTGLTASRAFAVIFGRTAGLSIATPWS
jgi:hypothetical protein